jgi:hypothetical protein
MAVSFCFIFWINLVVKKPWQGNEKSDIQNRNICRKKKKPDRESSQVESKKPSMLRGNGFEMKTRLSVPGAKGINQPELGFHPSQGYSKIIAGGCLQSCFTFIVLKN